MSKQIGGSRKITQLNKGLGFLDPSASSAEVAALKWNLLREDVSLPAAVLYQDRVKHNLRWMQQFIERYGVLLAPHGKTTMAPKLFQMQLENGAWGITVATAQQAVVAYEHGVCRVLMANELIGKQNMAMVARMVADPSFEYYCLVDSAMQVDQLGRFFLERRLKLAVLLELGVPGGRSGIRNEDQLREVVESLRSWKDTISLRGVEVYEGVLEEEDDIREFLKRAVRTTQELAKHGRFQGETILLSGAGSAWYDIVAEIFAAAEFQENVQVILRPGCYLTHDVGAYQRAQARIESNDPIANSLAHEMSSGLLPALHIWAYVQSIPEPNKAIIGLGKRDAAFDAGLPVPTLHYRPGSEAPKPALGHWTATKMMDQHLYLQIGEGDGLCVGDMLGFDISHPCLTFDKWRNVLILNEAFDVVDVIETYF